MIPVIAVLCLVFGVGTFLVWAQRNNAFALTTATQQSFVELYFNDPASLPTTALPGERRTFGFVISNPGTTVRQVTYLVQLQDNTGVIGLDSRTYTLQPGETIHRKTTVTFPAASGQKTATMVSFLNSTQSIRFYTEL